MNSGENFAPRGLHGRPLHFLIQSCSWDVLRLHKAHAAVHQFRDFPAPRFEVRKMTVCDKSTRRLSPKVSVALSSIPKAIARAHPRLSRFRRTAKMRALASPYGSSTALPA